MSRRPSKALREQIFARAGYCCEYCWSQLHFCPDPINAEHITPHSRGGETTLDNLAGACFGCNGKKGERISATDPVSGNDAPLYHPRKDAWEQHFRWSDDFLYLIGLTATGRATIDLLDLNRLGVVNLRLVLRAQNLHPPKMKDVSSSSA